MSEILIKSDNSKVIEHLQKRLAMFEKYIHTNSCSDECGWFAFFVRDGEEIDLPNWRVNGYETEEEAIAALVAQAVDTFTEKGWV